MWSSRKHAMDEFHPNTTFSLEEQVSMIDPELLDENSTQSSDTRNCLC